jgi:tetratricopeptide (TPR) repeat protein
VVNHGWARPAADLVTGRGTTRDRGNTNLSDRRPYPWWGYADWHHNRSLYGWGGSYASYYSSYPSYYAYYPSYPQSGWGGYSSSYGSYPYGNPYLPSGTQTDSGASGYSYQPAPSSAVRGEQGAANTDKETAAAESNMILARRAFQRGDYAEAREECEEAIRLRPGDANLLDFRALCQFAQGTYTDAAATLHESIVGTGPGWDWNTLSSFYSSAKTYTTQLRALERYVRENPTDAAGHFVLMYHSLVLDERDAALDQLQEVIKLQPSDKVAAGILAALEKAKTDKPETPLDKPAPGR